MNRFRTKKKAKETSESLVRASTESDASAIQPVKKSKTFGRGKKNPEPEPKPELDLANALPPSDDFRTSLLMNGLSARFSMLREQDDPKSKIGKASDDSVLFPNRQSRFNDLTFQSHGLSDIAEVASINGSIRPPFAITRKDSYDTTGSFGTDDDSTHGSIMNRAKPGEGNNLFGGRQKIYKIPVTASGSTRSLAEAGGSGMGGRALYGDDVSQSAFQKLREREREQEQERERLASLEQEESEAQSSRPPSPPLSGYNRNRETSSTTSSGGPSNTRTSTAATSFTSQRTPSLNGSHTPITPGGSVSNGGLERSTTKARRLYETGLDQHLHEQQFSAMNRIDTLTRQRTLGSHTPPLVNSPTNITHQGEKWERRPIAGQASMPNLRAASPPLNVNPLNTFDFAIRSNNAPETKAYGMASPPLSPPMSEHDDPSILPVQPNDRGKATALGAFAKPVQPYDENKYSQRQLQMQQGRKSPPIRKNSPPRAFPAPHQQPMSRIRAESNATFASGRSRSNSSAQRQFLPSDRIPEAQSPPPQSKLNISKNRAIANGAFLSSPDESVTFSPVDHTPKPQLRPTPQPLDLSRMNFQDRNVNLQRPPESQHPANRQRPIAENSSHAVNESNDIPPHPPVTPSESKNPPAEDSPTLGPTSTMSGLSGMVRQHLRSDSNNSSIYGGAPSAGLTSRFPVDSSEPTTHVDYNRRSNPWDNEDWDQAYHESYEPSREPAMNGAVPAPLSFPSTNASTEQAGRPSWERDLDAHHTRDGSTETQKERQHFKNDLAERRKRVQENLKSFVETESRSASPLPGSEWSRDGNAGNVARNNPLGLLKSKSRRGSLVGRTKEPSPASQAKAMKMMGLGSTTISSSQSPGKQSFEANHRKQEIGDQASQVPSPVKNPGGPVIPPQTKAFRQARRDAQRDRERQITNRHQQKPAREADRSEWPSSPAEFHPRPNEQRRENVPPNIRVRQRSPSRDRKPPPVTLSHRNGSLESKGSVGSNRSGSGPPSRASRDRSSSDASGRSKSRNGRYKDDLAKAMAEGISSSSQGMYDELEPPPSARFPQKSPGTPGSQYQPSPVPSPMIMGPNGRSRSNSRATTGYFDSQTLQPVQTNVAMAIGNFPRPSPTAPFSANSTPAQPSSAVSAATTPTTQGFQPQGHRKKSINKSDISEPKFVSSTSRVSTVNLPPEASLQNGMEAAPPIPPVNPMRRQTRRMFGLKKDSDGEVQLMPAATQSTEEMSTFSADEGDSKPKSRKLRKSSSEGGNLNARARQAVNAQPSPAMPSATFPASRGDSPPRAVDGGMF
ncbi:hypothetical protein LAWI1_G008879 [Lachnellula willkommii]|uniref:Uncharacterized protein n=1 Tax=Lachnellula willkommii TaxID=215461 RepID=A0A559MAU2_9HELO|nr:hypothetical protein LAWI1_G008879 [Lachnellula willkommii]